MLRKVMLEIEVHEDYMERTLETIQTVAKTGSEGAIGDGKVFILPTLDLGMNQ
jgi:nitrogen regulatory protein P-II 1